MSANDSSKGVNNPLEDLLTNVPENINSRLFGKFVLIGLATLYFGFFSVRNVTYHNSVMNYSNKRVVWKADGVFSHTEIAEVKDGGTNIRRVGSTLTSLDCSPSSISYIDNDDDGNVDEIHFFPTLGNSCDGGYLRRIDFGENTQLFLEADRELQEQIQRFKPYLERWNTPM